MSVIVHFYLVHVDVDLAMVLLEQWKEYLCGQVWEPDLYFISCTWLKIRLAPLFWTGAMHLVDNYHDHEKNKEPGGW